MPTTNPPFSKPTEETNENFNEWGNSDEGIGLLKHFLTWQRKTTHAPDQNISALAVPLRPSAAFLWSLCSIITFRCGSKNSYKLWPLCSAATFRCVFYRRLVRNRLAPRCRLLCRTPNRALQQEGNKSYGLPPCFRVPVIHQ